MRFTNDGCAVRSGSWNESRLIGLCQWYTERRSCDEIVAPVVSGEG